MPMEWVMDPDREPMIAIQMNGEPLPRAHGYPGAADRPGLFGYVSATKWLSELELTTWEAFDAYWVPLGWAKEGPILTQSRIDTPRGTVTAGRVPIAGVAWAPDRGISKVEVGIDGDWHEPSCRRRSRTRRGSSGCTPWDAAPGSHDDLGPRDRRQTASSRRRSRRDRPPTVRVAGTRSRSTS